MKRYFLTITSFLVCFLGLASTSFGQTATVAAWNIEGFAPVAPAKAKRLAKAIHNMSPDVIALTEVNPDSVVSQIVSELAALGDSYHSKILPQTASQNVAILFKSNVSVTNERLIARSDDMNSALRKALAVDVKLGNFDFVLIAVHMKSGRPTNNRNTNPQPVRTRQARAIARFINQVRQTGENDILVVGDYNMIPAQDGVYFNAMSPGSGSNEFLRFISSESFAGRFSHISGCLGGQPRGNLLDGFAISKGHTREFVTDSLRLVRFNDTSIFTSDSGAALNCVSYTGFISDHLPLIARFRANQSDDDYIV